MEKALLRLPEECRRVLGNLAIVVEDWPDTEWVAEVTGAPEEVLYGLFTGTPLPKSAAGNWPYQGPLADHH